MESRAKGIPKRVMARIMAAIGTQTAKTKPSPKDFRKEVLITAWQRFHLGLNRAIRIKPVTRLPANREVLNKPIFRYRPPPFFLAAFSFHLTSPVILALGSILACLGDL